MRSSHSSLPDVDVLTAVDTLQARMKKPIPGIRDSFFPDLQAIDFNEVVQRGINMRPPASETAVGAGSIESGCQTPKTERSLPPRKDLTTGAKRRSACTLLDS